MKLKLTSRGRLSFSGSVPLIWSVRPGPRTTTPHRCSVAYMTLTACCCCEGRSGRGLVGWDGMGGLEVEHRRRARLQPRPLPGPPHPQQQPASVAAARLREAGQAQPVERGAQQRAQVLKAAVGAAAQHNAAAGVERGKVGFEGNVAWGHGQTCMGVGGVAGRRPGRG